GSGIRRYAYELYNNLARNANENESNINIKFTEISPLFNKERAFTNFIAAYKFMLFSRVVKADIFHFIAHNPAIN
ncbi:MAG: hypothetical protein ACP5JU_03830, partial [Minisyncoccia bacterium]